MNIFIGTGTVYKKDSEPKIIETKNGKATMLINLCIAVERNYSVDGKYFNDRIWFDAWSELADTIHKEISVGDTVSFQSSVKVESYTKDEEKKYITKFQLSSIKKVFNG